MNFIFEYLFFLPVLLIKLYISSSLIWTFWPENNINNLYDYIVVGAGSSGIVVATRLAQSHPDKGVLLIESGPDPTSWFSFENIPILTPMFFGTSYDWQYQTVPQKYACLGLDQQSCRWTAGHVVGGSSRINNMVYLRGHSKDVRPSLGDISEDEWLSYSLKAEKQTGFYSFDTNFHTTTGPWDVSDLTWASPLAKSFLEAASSLGYPNRDLNAQHSTGFMQVQMNQRNGSRFSIDRAYLTEAPREYLRVLSNTFVSRVILSSEYRATAICLSHYGCQKTIHAQKGIILAAGTVGTPKLLMLSGIGPREHLEYHGIPVRVNSPHVGANLQDHILTGLDLVHFNSSWLLTPWDLAAPFSLLHYFLNGRGPLTSGGCEAVALLPRNYRNFNNTQDDLPSFQLSVLNTGLTVDYGAVLRHALGVNDKIWETYFLPKLNTPSASITVTLLHPQSRGSIRLASSNPKDPPLIDPQYLSYQDDIKVLIEGLRLVYDLLQTEPMQKLGAKFNRKILPDCGNLLNEDETEAPIPNNDNASSCAYWSCYIRQLSFSHYHPIGSAALGRVLDRNFGVHGVTGLYVVDASAMPSLPSANIHSAVIVRAEAAADKILENQKKYSTEEIKKRLLIQKQITCPCQN